MSAEKWERHDGRDWNKYPIGTQAKRITESGTMLWKKVRDMKDCDPVSESWTIIGTVDEKMVDGKSFYWEVLIPESPTATKIRCTSICHYRNGNNQIDYQGTRHNCIAEFEAWCLKNDIIWGRLYLESNGELVAMFKNGELVSY